MAAMYLKLTNEEIEALCAVLRAGGAEEMYHLDKITSAQLAHVKLALEKIEAELASRP